MKEFCKLSAKSAEICEIPDRTGQDLCHRKDNQQKAQLEEDEVTAKAKAAFAEIRAMAERGEFPEMTLDEINEEIREVRRLRKERNHSS